MQAWQNFQLQCVTLPLMSIFLFLFPLNKYNRVCPLFALPPFCLYLAYCIMSHREGQESALPNPQYVVSVLEIIFDLPFGFPTNNIISLVSVGEPAHLLALWARRKSAQSGSTPTLQRDQTRPSCEFVHCSCHRCNVFRVPQGGWRDALPGPCPPAHTPWAHSTCVN